MNSSIQDAIEIIDQRIANLQNIKKMLLDEFGGERTPPAGFKVRASIVPASNSNGNGHSPAYGGGRTRRDELMAYLTEHGPAKRGEIIAGTTIPKGTIASLLNKAPFIRRSDGKWQVDTSSASQETAQ